MKNILFLLSLWSLTLATATSGPFTSVRSFFGIRGGGLFGGNDDSKATPPPSDVAPKYPPMTETEIEDWMEHIPVFAVTDSNGAGVVLKPDDGSSVFYFFMNPLAANATLGQLKSSNVEMDLKISAFSLGKIWFKLLQADADQEVVLKEPGTEGDGQMQKGVEYRLVPDTRDLLGARMLLTMSPEDSEKLKGGETMTAEMAQAAIEKAMTDSPKFKATFNEIPVFTIAQMRMQKAAEEGEGGEPVTLLPMYFSLQNMVGTWQQFMGQAPADMQNVEPAINLMSLHELVAMMQTECEIDFRNVVLVPSAPTDESGPGAGASMEAPADSMANSMGGATLGDL
uniref:Uncharacterized protein n=1 Tax=Craspedostauros australis TaxID=1486917 RepID=A0A7R9ZNZ8_9STRA|mmetsp:Transcript_22486/g.62749  ORF Transcript_22486/g.62749 Transcript_22486/m.62749 type:complete len:340 (+) Transcript_22486:134-1153(+)|eukprot:CAMPEP_0198113112 /NCGR_PEP_ID=MMETSP1442-20131203/4861_1 /TAXON_ID= /ORGANISM="Craspedostauros australis, Strain CCMP3328" /LENGTH=339 /DNA_ID=CAMNT_0043770121 /DNA_START=126 /DNA_END=1145 /DNA_ORIENTATION=-